MHIGPKEGGTEFYKVLEGSRGFQGDSREGSEREVRWKREGSQDRKINLSRVHEAISLKGLTLTIIHS